MLTIIGGALVAWLPTDNKAGLLAGNFLTNTVGSSERILPYLWRGRLTVPKLSHSYTPRLLAIVGSPQMLLPCWKPTFYCRHWPYEKGHDERSSSQVNFLNNQINLILSSRLAHI